MDRILDFLQLLVIFFSKKTLGSKKTLFKQAYFEYKNDSTNIQKKLEAQELMHEWIGAYADLQVMDMVVNSYLPNTEYCKLLVYENGKVLQRSTIKRVQADADIVTDIVVLHALFVFVILIVKVLSFLGIAIWKIDHPYANLLFTSNFKNIKSAIDCIILIVLNNFLLFLWASFSLLCLLKSSAQQKNFRIFDYWCKQNNVGVSETLPFSLVKQEDGQKNIWKRIRISVVEASKEFTIHIAKDIHIKLGCILIAVLLWFVIPRFLSLH